MTMPIEEPASTALITNDAVVLGLLAVILGAAVVQFVLMLD